MQAQYIYLPVKNILHMALGLVKVHIMSHNGQKLELDEKKRLIFDNRKIEKFANSFSCRIVKLKYLMVHVGYYFIGTINRWIQQVFTFMSYTFFDS